MQAKRLRFILVNKSGSNLFACLRTSQCNPLINPAILPNDSTNLYTENFETAHSFSFNLQTNNETTQYKVQYNPQAKIIQLQRGGIVFDEINYNADIVSAPVIIDIDRKLDAYFNMEAWLEEGVATGFNQANGRGYKPSLYLGDAGPQEPRRDKNHFCKKNTPCRNDISTLNSHLGICTHKKPSDNLNPFCKENKSCPKRCS